ncbi:MULTISPECIES: BTAD domain-containing putative transcriptional regulator [unclassified Sinorhizobium]|uniref:BTAD domain-containing putative transcriptional regulator n=1 Tax=unclassified Sinorhizobium TaxID=2613772 RepID=UPI00352360E2
MTSTKTRRLRLFGPPSLEIDGVLLNLPEKTYFLLAVLVASPASMIDRNTARVLLWPSQSPEKRANSLRQLLARIFKSLGPDLHALLTVNQDRIILDRTLCEIDLADLLNSVGQEVRPQWSLLDGELLEGMPSPTGEAEEWLSDMRQRIADWRIRHLETLLENPDIIGSSNLPSLAERLIMLDQTNESASRALMRHYNERGDLASMRRAYFTCRNRLRVEIGADPEQATTQLARDLGILGDDPLHRTEPVIRKSDKIASEQPRVVILPPEAIVSDPLIQRLGRVLLEDVTISLSHQRVFKIIAAHTSFALIDQSIGGDHLRSAVRELDFDYSVYVTIQGDGEALLATCRLTKVGTGEVLWAIDLPLDLQKLSASFSTLARRISSSLTDVIEREELATSLDDVDPSAYRLYLEGKRHLAGTDLQALRQARKWFKSAVRRCDAFSPAHAGISRSLGMEWLVRGMKDNELLGDANQYARASRDRDPGSGRAYRELGFIALYRRRFDESLELFEQAQSLNPSDADVLVDFSDALSHAGDLDKALELGLSAFRLNPLPPDYYYWILGSTYYVRQEYEKAIKTIEPVKEKLATARLLAACHAMAGNISEARRYAGVVLENFPDFRSEDIRHFVPDRNPEHADLLIRGLQLAGL